MTSRRAAKAIARLSEELRLLVGVLVDEIRVSGPVRGNWKNYSKLSATKHHCHIKGGRPTYVVCWEVINTERRLVEIYYAGTHEKAPY